MTIRRGLARGAHQIKLGGVYSRSMAVDDNLINGRRHRAECLGVLHRLGRRVCLAAGAACLSVLLQIRLGGPFIGSIGLAIIALAAYVAMIHFIGGAFTVSGTEGGASI